VNVSNCLVWPLETDFARRTEQALTGPVRTPERLIVSYVAYSVIGIVKGSRRPRRGSMRRSLSARVCGAHDGIAALRPVVDLGSVVYEWPLDRRPTNGRGDPGALHAKFALADGETLFVTSANLTEAAFEFNMELGAVIRGGPQPTRLAETLTWLLSSGNLRAVGTTTAR
jgi:hypothetical protein